MQQPLLLAIGNAGGCTAKRIAAPVAYFNEHPGLAIAHDQVELTAAQRNIGGEESEPGAFQIVAGL
ncbi:hypothetical protein D3C80_825760 [compost metagenome]